MGLIRFTVKATVVGGIVYYTYHEGLWSRPEETAKVYRKISTNIAPYVDHDLVKGIVKSLPEKPQIPSISGSKLWNDGVMVSINFMANLPNHIAKGACSVYGAVKRQMADLNK